MVSLTEFHSAFSVFFHAAKIVCIHVSTAVRKKCCVKRVFTLYKIQINFMKDVDDTINDFQLVGLYT